MKQLLITLLLFVVIVYVITWIVSRAFGILGLAVTQLQVFALIIVLSFILWQLRK